MVKERNIFLVYLFTVITLGIYFIYWEVSTKNEINSLGADIPTGWLIIVPIANIYWVYKYCEGFADKVKKDNNTILWFIVYVLIGIVMPAIVQSELNKLAQSGTKSNPSVKRPSPTKNRAPPRSRNLTN